MKRPDSLNAAIESAKSEIARYVNALEAKNLKLLKQIAHLGKPVGH